MTGLEEMKTVILEESRRSAGHILEEARKTAEAILAEAKAGAQADAAALLKKAEEEKEQELRRAESGGELERKKTLLKQKTDLINETMALALERLGTLKDDDYFSVIKRLVAANARAGEGELQFSARDLARLPAGYAAELNRALPAGLGPVSISKTPAPLKDGFLLVYGDIEQNCSFDALMESGLETVKDLLYRELFS